MDGDPGGHPSQWQLADYSGLSAGQGGGSYAGHDGKTSPAPPTIKPPAQLHPHLQYLALWKGYPREFLPPGVKDLIDASK